jgi:hypothetical protein
MQDPSNRRWLFCRRRIFWKEKVVKYNFERRRIVVCWFGGIPCLPDMEQFGHIGFAQQYVT